MFENKKPQEQTKSCVVINVYTECDKCEKGGHPYGDEKKENHDDCKDCRCNDSCVVFNVYTKCE